MRPSHGLAKLLLVDLGTHLLHTYHILYILPTQLFTQYKLDYERRIDTLDMMMRTWSAETYCRHTFQF